MKGILALVLAAATPGAPEVFARNPQAQLDGEALVFSFEHHVKSGTVRLWLDGAMLVDERLSGRVTQDLKVVKLRTAKLQKKLSVPAGTHQIRVEMRSGQDSRAKETTAIFRAGGTRRLEAGTNRITGGLSIPGLF